MRETTCCFAGRGVIPQYLREEVEKRLEDKIIYLLQKGADTFVTCGGAGFDTLAAQKVLDLKELFPHIRLELVLAGRGGPQGRQGRGTSAAYEAIKARADGFSYASNTHRPATLVQCERVMVQMSSWCVFYLQQTPFNACYAAKYAREYGLHLLPL